MSTKENDSLKQAQEMNPIDILVEVVEARYSEKRTISRRWWGGLIVGLVSIISGTGIFFSSSSSEDVANDAAKEVFGLFARSASLVDTSLMLLPDSPILIELKDNESQYLRPEIQFDESVEVLPFQISASAVGGIDPVISLYRQRGTTQQPEIVSSDDDGGRGLNSQMEVSLFADEMYELEVSEFHGDSGSVEVLMTQVE